MKLQLLFREIVATLAILVFIAGCKNIGDNELSTNGPKLTLHKTSSDYSNFVHIWAGEKAPNFYSLGDRIIVVGNDTIYRYPIQLIDGYILDGEYSVLDFFTNITFGELAKYNQQHTDYFPLDSMFKRVIDKDPFLEFYIAKTYHTFEEVGATDSADFVAKINNLITNGEIEKYFDREK